MALAVVAALAGLCIGLVLGVAQVLREHRVLFLAGAGMLLLAVFGILLLEPSNWVAGLALTFSVIVSRILGVAMARQTLHADEDRTFWWYVKTSATSSNRPDAEHPRSEAEEASISSN
jgi:type III secretory pathway component EscS